MVKMQNGVDLVKFVHEKYKPHLELRDSKVFLDFVMFLTCCDTTLYNVKEILIHHELSADKEITCKIRTKNRPDLKHGPIIVNLFNRAYSYTSTPDIWAQF